MAAHGFTSHTHTHITCSRLQHASPSSFFNLDAMQSNVEVQPPPPYQQQQSPYHDTPSRAVPVVGVPPSSPRAATSSSSSSTHRPNSLLLQPWVVSPPQPTRSSSGGKLKFAAPKKLDAATTTTRVQGGGGPRNDDAGDSFVPPPPAGAKEPNLPTDHNDDDDEPKQNQHPSDEVWAEVDTEEHLDSDDEQQQQQDRLETTVPAPVDDDDDGEKQPQEDANAVTADSWEAETSVPVSVVADDDESSSSVHGAMDDDALSKERNDASSLPAPEKNSPKWEGEALDQAVAQAWTAEDVTAVTMERDEPPPPSEVNDEEDPFEANVNTMERNDATPEDQATTVNVKDVPHIGEVNESDLHQQHQQQAPATPVHETPMHTRTKLLLLISSSSINRQVKVRQDLAELALNAAGIEFETLDGAVEEHRDLRNELFVVSGIRGEYPQFFLVDLSNGGTTFWGAWEQFEHANDDGRLMEEFGSSGPIPQTPMTPVLQQRHGLRSITGAAAVVPDEVLENFSNQIKRIEENYQIERSDMEQRHARELQEAANHEFCELARREVEERLMADIKVKDEQLQELCRRNEGYRLKLDVLKREVTGTQDLLQARDSDVVKANQKFLNDLRAMEKQLVAAERKASMSQEDVQKLQIALDTTRSELVASKEEHNDLKARVKIVAGELKDRRGECRELHVKLDELTNLNRNLRATVDSLEERLNHQGMSQTEKDEEMEELRAKLVEAGLTLERTEKAWKEREAKNEQALLDYKKKAQNSLSMANSRTAAAVQAREEAELDARAARTTADSAFERATKAEIASREAVAGAKVVVKEMEVERDIAVRERQIATDGLKANEKQLASTLQKLEQAVAAKESKAAELESIRSELNSEQSKVAFVEQKLMESMEQADSLRGELESLRSQLQHAKAAVDAAETKADSGEGKSQTPPTANGESPLDKHGDDTVVEALQQELREANEAIEDLKAALMNAVEMKDQSGQTSSSEAANRLDDYSERGNSGSDSIPLFYAMEKQAELKTARAEINRLASVLADVQSEKAEAHEAVEDMRRRMEDAEARLKRFKKLGSGSRHEDSSTPTSSSEPNNGSAPSQPSDSVSVNIEYLKHIMLRFLNAKTVLERKTLVPVIGAVLELTPNELTTALQSVEQSATGASSGLFGFMS